MIYYVLDLYPSDDPKDGARLCRLGTLQSAEITGESNGSGQGRFTTRGTDTTAQFLDPNGLQYIRVRRVNTAVVDGATLSGFSELVVMGFFTDSGANKLLDEKGTKSLEWGGAGTMVYYSRGVMDFDSWINDPFIGTDPQPDGTWPLHLAGTGNELGAILWRVLHELEEPGRHQNPVPAMTLGFTYLLDSNGAPWVRETGDFVAQVSDNIIDIILRLMEMGLYVEVDPDTFEINAYEPDTHRRDRTGGAWGTNVVRFQAPTGSDLTTGNIESDLTRGMDAKVRRNAILVGSKDTWEWVTDPGILVPWEGGKIIDDEDGAALLKIGEAQLTARGDAADTIRLRMKLGNDPANGFYLPFEHIKLDDLVTVHTGTGPLDYNEATFPVAALTLILRPGGDWEAWADLGSTYFTIEQRTFRAQPVGAHTHPPNPQLCRAITAVQPTVSYLSGWQSNVYGFTTVPAGTNRMLIAVGMWPGHGIADWYGTYDGNPMTPLGSHVHIVGASEAHLQAFYVLDPTEAPGGLGPQVGVFGTDVNSNPYPNYLHYIVLNGVNPLDPVAAVVSAFGTGTLSGPGAIPQGGVESIGFMFGTGGDASHDAPVEVATFTDGWSYGSNVYSISAAAGYGAADPEWSHLGSEVWAAMGIAVNGFGTSVGDGHADLIGTSVRAKRCDDTEHYHTTGDPTVNDDTSSGFRNGTLWINESTGAMFLLLDNADGAADWLAVGGGGADLSGINFLVGTGSGDLTAEIVVGTTPGGELGGTWPSPTVDATHSGSAHTDFVAKAIVDAKGDLIAGTANDTVDNLAAGSNGSGLVTASGETTGLKWRKHNDAATAAPTVNDDSGDGYEVGSHWLDTTNDKEYVLLDATVGAAVWKERTNVTGAGTTIIVREVAGTDIEDVAELEFDADDFVVTEPSAGIARVALAAPGGGGSGRPLVDPTVLSWSWINEGVATIATQDATLLLHSPAEAADNWHFRVKSVPSKPYTVIIHMLPALMATDFSGAGVGWLQTSNNDFAVCAQLHNGNLHLASSKSATDFIVTANYVDTAPHHQYWEWVMLTDTAGGNRTMSVSRDGYNWLLFHSVATDDHITPDRLFFGLEARNGTYPAGLTIDSWEEL